MRCIISNPKTLRRLSSLVGFEIDLAMTRGGTGHRIDIWRVGVNSRHGRPFMMIWPDKSEPGGWHKEIMPCTPGVYMHCQWGSD